MIIFAALAAPALLLATPAVAAQTPVPAHQGHQTTGQDQDKAGDCCCEKMMQRMSKEMKHQGKGTPATGQQAPERHDQHEH